MSAAQTPMPQYPLPWKILPGLVKSLLAGEQRSFRLDAVRLVQDAAIPLEINGREHIPNSGPALLTVNHYSRPGFQAWWLALAISALLPAEIHWIMTAAWTADGSPGASLRAIFSQRIFPHLARMYGFTAMPPMPPRPFEVEGRALAVRRVLKAAKAQPPPIIATAPEGQDNPGGTLMLPHPGVGRFLLHLAQQGYPVYPVGVYEQTGALCISFGAPYRMALPAGLPSAEADHQVAQIVMRAIARQLPERLRGDFNP